MVNKVRHYHRYSDEDVINSAKKVKSLGALLRSLGLKVAGGNYANMKRTLQRLNLDCSHWTGQAWNKGQRTKDWSEYKRGKQLKSHLIKERGYQCENCNLEEWLDVPIPLEVDHIDGDRTNNDENNLKLLCCNCHALTPTWRGRNNVRKEIKQRYCFKCDKKISLASKSGLCRSCFNKARGYTIVQRKVKDRPSKDQLSKEVEETNYCAVGRNYGVSDNCIRKWLK